MVSNCRECNDQVTFTQQIKFTETIRQKSIESESKASHNQRRIVFFWNWVGVKLLYVGGLMKGQVSWVVEMRAKAQPTFYNHRLKLICHCE
uniref:Uncharacterized protein n=1 Tax=Kalanchoe fedtschenkoi TaxID=63787 RepID=A0A7N0UP72_KALFE